MNLPNLPNYVWWFIWFFVLLFVLWVLQIHLSIGNGSFNIGSGLLK